MAKYRKAVIEDAEALARTRVDFLAEVDNVNSQDERELLYENNRQFMSEALADGRYLSMGRPIYEKFGFVNVDNHMAYYIPLS